MIIFSGSQAKFLRLGSGKFRIFGIKIKSGIPQEISEKYKGIIR
jgi:hypothetical protein